MGFMTTQKNVNITKKKRDKARLKISRVLFLMLLL